MRFLAALLLACSSTPAPAPTPTPLPAPAPASAPASAPSPEPAAPPATATLTGVDRACAADSAERADALARVKALDAQIRALRPAGDHRPANAALIALLDHPCMKLADVAAGDLRAEAAPALLELWDQGGHSWLLDRINLATVESLSFAPTLRKVVAAETRPGHPAFSLLCSLADPDCGASTRGWWQRAERAFRDRAAPVYRGRDRPAATEAICAAEARARPRAERFAHWEECAAAIGERRAAMPLGGIKKPTSGWLIVRGRRGHYSFCDEVRITSLATGAAYISKSCSELFVAEGDQVRNGTAADRKPAVKRGTIPLANVRELAWMLLHTGEVTAEHRPGYGRHDIPDGIERVKGPKRVSEHEGRVRVISSDQTTLAWAVTDRRRALISGTLTWPTDYGGGAMDHALDLLRIAEAGFVEGCPREKPPKLSSFGRARPAVSPLDGDEDELALLEGDLVDAIDKIARARCRQSNRRAR
jgi:hypothetical protein